MYPNHNDVHRIAYIIKHCSLILFWYWLSRIQFFCVSPQGQDASFDQALSEFYMPYHIFVDFMVRVAVNKNCLTNDLVNLSE